MTDIRTEKLHARLRVRGITPSNDPEFVKMAPWTRLTFSLCTSVGGLATVLAWPGLLWVMVGIATAGAIGTRHPFDHVYNLVVRRFTGTIELPRNGAPTRFSCGIAAVWFATMAIAFSGGYDLVAYGLGAMFIVVGALISITHFCIPSVIFQLMFGDSGLIKPSIVGGATP
jgi:hypothetical protein